MLKDFDNLINNLIFYADVIVFIQRFKETTPGRPELSTILSNYESRLKNRIELRDSTEKAWNDLQDQLTLVDKQLNDKILEMQSISCISPTDGDDTIPPGNEVNSLGQPTEIKLSDPTLPSILSIKYWKKFCQLSSIVGTAPIYWATGILVPGPNGIIPIPTPIIYKPIVVIPTNVGIYVLIIGQRGVLPCPILYQLIPGNKSIFLQGLRSSNQVVASIPGKPPTTKLSTTAYNQLFTNQLPISQGVNPPTITSVPSGVIGEAVNAIIKPFIGKEPKANPNDLLKGNPTFYEQDDLPPWERLSINNTPFLKYLIS